MSAFPCWYSVYFGYSSQNSVGKKIDSSGNIVYSKMGYSNRVMNDIGKILAE